MGQISFGIFEGSHSIGAQPNRPLRFQRLPPVGGGERHKVREPSFLSLNDATHLLVIGPIGQGTVPAAIGHSAAIGAALHPQLRAGEDVPPTARIEAYLVRVLLGDSDEPLVEGRESSIGVDGSTCTTTVANVVLAIGRLVHHRPGAGIGPSLDLGPQVQRRHHRPDLLDAGVAAHGGHPVHGIAQEAVPIAAVSRRPPPHVGKGTTVGTVGGVIEDPGDACHGSREDEPLLADGYRSRTTTGQMRHVGGLDDLLALRRRFGGVGPGLFERRWRRRG
mmetsp:Transcript_2575/g.7565  ORF Transcript_2575/g.7565 Transcript_2575/m.7565 type:complete len:277 (+) Transcript_2575:502-1332(+)